MVAHAIEKYGDSADYLGFIDVDVRRPWPRVKANQTTRLRISQC